MTIFGANPQSVERFSLGQSFVWDSARDRVLWQEIDRGEVRSYSPNNRHLDTVQLDAPNTSSVTLVGPDLDLHQIATVRVDLIPEKLERLPDSGFLFTDGSTPLVSRRSHGLAVQGSPKCLFTELLIHP